MMLYEFTVTDEFDLSKDDILAAADRTAVKQSGFMSWGNYKVIERKAPERLKTGEIRYFFSVEGEYASSADSECNSQTRAVVRDTRSSAASSEL